MNAAKFISVNDGCSVMTSIVTFVKFVPIVKISLEILVARIEDGSVAERFAHRLLNIPRNPGPFLERPLPIINDLRNYAADELRQLVYDSIAEHENRSIMDHRVNINYRGRGYRGRGYRGRGGYRGRDYRDHE